MLENPRTKRLALIAVFLAACLGIATTLYLLFFKESIGLPPEAQPITGVPQGSLPISGRATSSTQGIDPGFLPSARGIQGDGRTTDTPVAPVQTTFVLSERLAQFPSASPSVRGDGMRLYDPNDGRFYRVRTDGTVENLGDKAFPNVQSVSWGHATDKAVLEFPDGSNIIYDFENKRQYTLPKHWEDFDFSPNDEQIAAKSIGNNENNRFLITSDLDGSNTQLVEELGENGDKVQVAWSPNNQIIAFAHTGESIGMDREQVLLVSKNRENVKGLIVEGRGLIPNWSPNGKTLLYSVYNSGNGFRPELWISGASPENVNENRRYLNINTWADKCTWLTNDSFLCSVPSALSQGAALQRDIAQTGPESFVRINLKTGTRTDLGSPDGNPSVQNLNVTGDGRAAIFTDRATGQLIRYDLPL